LSFLFDAVLGFGYFLFIRVLVCGIITGSRLSKIKEIHIADAQLTKYGFHALAALLVCDKVGIEELQQ
jgi:hypothetical protein